MSLNQQNSGSKSVQLFYYDDVKDIWVPASITDPMPVSATISGGIGQVAQGNPNTLTNGWPVKITDGVSILGTLANPVKVDLTGATTQQVAIADGADVDEGSTTDPAIVTDSSGTLSAKLRGLVTISGSRTSFYITVLTLTSGGGVNNTQGPNISIAPGKNVVVKAYRSNTGVVYLGTSSANVDLASSRDELEKKDIVKLALTNLNELWFGTSITGSQVVITVET